MAKSTTQPPLYQPLDFAMVRAPLLPVEAFLPLQTAADLHTLLKDPRVQRAVAVGSVSLTNALHRREQAALTPRDEEKLTAKVLRYQIRMSTRPTPYGLFAGCAVVPFGDKTDLTILSTFGASHTRPDMSWLMNFVVTAESNPAIRRKLRLSSNPLIRFEGGRIALPSLMPGRKDEKHQPVSVRATRVAEKAIEFAKNGIDYADLAAQLLDASPAATPEKVDRLLDDLLEQTFLLTDLRPPLTTNKPAQYVLDRLCRIPEAAEPRETLHAFLQKACRWDRIPHPESVREFQALLKSLDCPDDGSKDPPCQVDMALSVQGGVGSALAREAARGAELLLRLSSNPGGMSSLAAYRNAFVSRYGDEREVPVLELLDPSRGLGPVSAHGHAFTGPDHVKASKRARTLLALACSALHQRERVLSLDESTIRNLETSQVTPENAPVSLDINLMVAAESAAAIDDGKFTVVVGPNLGAWAAGRNFGRFAYLHPSENGIAPLQRCAAAEEAGHFPDHLWAEVVWLPANVRSANVAVRPAIRTHEVLFGVAPGVPESNVLSLEDLAVGVDSGRFYIRSQKENKRVRFVSGHMLNHHGAPPLVQFLLDVSHDRVTTFTSFDWGQAEAFPFLPRVQAGQIVLRPAEWKLTKEALATPNPEALSKWREDWNVPRCVCLTFGDNRLILDLTYTLHQQQILTELARLAEGQSLQLQEVLPAIEDAWLKGEEGHYYSEFIVPLVLNKTAALKPVQTVPVSAPAVTTSSVRRLRPPGTEWLYAKLYCPNRCEDQLISERLLPMAENAVASGLADSWFFIRYGDPEGHIRLRFHGESDRLSTHLFGQLSQWTRGMVDDGICTRIVFDTYDREIERYGGPEGTDVAERIFHADSRYAAALVKVLRSKPWEDPSLRTALFALSVDDLSRVCGFNDEKRLAWYKSQAGNNGPDVGAEYRKLKTVLRRAIGDRTKWLAEIPFGDAIAGALNQRAQDLSGPSDRLLQLAADATLSQSPEKILASYAHLHLNRIGGASSERMLLSLLLRTRASLANAPL